LETPLTKPLSLRAAPRLAAVCSSLCAAWASVGHAQVEAPTIIELPAPRQSGGLPLMEALSKPAVPLDLGGGRLSMQHLSNLLWAGAGRGQSKDAAASGGAAVPHKTDIYVLLKAGAFAYDPVAHSLKQIAAQDIRGLCGLDDPRWQAPVTLVYVVDLAASVRPGATEREMRAAVDAGLMAQNVSLYCASEGLSAGERAIADRRVLGRRLRLRPEQRIAAAQVIGYQQP
jgi:hypothetical protein